MLAAIRGAFPRALRGTQEIDEGLDWSTVRRDGVHPHLNERSFLPPTLAAIQISGHKDGAPVMPGDTASHLVAAVAEMWADQLTKFWLTNYVLTIRDLATIAERLPRLDTLMLRMSDSRKEVSVPKLSLISGMRLTCVIPRSAKMDCFPSRTHA